MQRGHRRTPVPEGRQQAGSPGWPGTPGWRGRAVPAAGGPPDVSVLSRRVQHWARRLEQEIDGVMRIFGGVQQLREVSLLPRAFPRGPSSEWGRGRRLGNKERGRGASAVGPMGAGGDATSKTVTPGGLGPLLLRWPCTRSVSGVEGQGPGRSSGCTCARKPEGPCTQCAEARPRHPGEQRCLSRRCHSPDETSRKPALGEMRDQGTGGVID